MYKTEVDNKPVQGRRQTLTVSNSIAKNAQLAEFLSAFFRDNAISEALFNDIRLVVEEAFVNIVDYAHEVHDRHPVTIELVHDKEQLVIRFIDRGVAFNPLENCVNCMEDNAHENGGMGIHLIKSLTDSQKYQRIDNRNIFTLIKYYT